MDVLGLLTRSSKKSFKPALTNERNALKSPKAHSEPTNVTATSDRGLKRKRGEQRSTTSESIPNFFGGQLAEIETTTTSEIDDEDLAHAQDVKVPTMDEGARRSYMKRHKLKVTVLESASPDVRCRPSDMPDAKKAKTHKSATAAASNVTTKGQQLFPEPLQLFSSLAARYDISRRLAQNIASEAYSTPTEVQSVAIPLLMDTRRGGDGLHGTDSSIDLLSVAPTGSGKTLAFLIPLIHELLSARRSDNEGDNAAGTKAIILAPTKELAHQITNEGRKLAANTGIKFTCVRKGMRLEQNDQTDRTEDNLVPAVKSDVLISTPLALLHAIQESSQQPHLDRIRHLVLDEADVLLDPLFRDQTLSVWDTLTSPRLRTSFWSATMGSNIEELVQDIISSRHTKLQISVAQAPLVRLVVGLKDSAVANIDHRLTFAATEQGKLMALRQLIHPTGLSTSTKPTVRAPFLVFVQTIERAVALHAELRYDIPMEAGGSTRIQVLHSRLSDTVRDSIMTGFRKGEIWVLITTDLLSRGVDFRGVNAVVNYDVPSSSAAYVHRVGRTGRSGRDGVAVTLYAKEDVPYIKSVVNVIAASQKISAEKFVSQVGEESVQQWLLEALPKVSKRDKKMLKKRGVEARRTPSDVQGATSGSGKSVRISTRTGYDRRKDHNRKAAIEARHRDDGQDPEQSGAESEFGGFED